MSDAVLKLNNVRLAFPVLFEAKAAQPGAKPKFSAAFLFPKEHPQKAEIERHIVEAAKRKWPTNYAEVLKALKAGDRLCLHDGDAKADKAGYGGNLFLNASNDVRPLAIGPDRAPLTAADGKLYAGCYVNVHVNLWAQDNQFGKRINASLLGVQFAKDGERLSGGGTSSADDFEPVPAASSEAPASADSIF